MEKNKVVLDTSVLLIPGRAPSRDIFLELLKLLGNYEAIVPAYVIAELRGITANRRKDARARNAAKIALEIVEKMVLETEMNSAAREGIGPGEVPGFVYEVRVENAHKSKPTVDDSLIDFAKKLGARLCTSDTGLRRKAESKEIAVLFIGPLKYPKRGRVKR